MAVGIVVYDAQLDEYRVATQDELDGMYAAMQWAYRVAKEYGREDELKSVISAAKTNPHGS